MDWVPRPHEAWFYLREFMFAVCRLNLRFLFPFLPILSHPYQIGKFLGARHYRWSKKEQGGWWLSILAISASVLCLVPTFNPSFRSSLQVRKQTDHGLAWHSHHPQWLAPLSCPWKRGLGHFPDTSQATGLLCGHCQEVRSLRKITDINKIKPVTFQGTWACGPENCQWPSSSW